MNCPSDVKRSDFDALLKSLPDGFVLKKSKARYMTGVKWARDFYFEITAPALGHKQGDMIIYSCATKIERRSGLDDPLHRR